MSARRRGILTNFQFFLIPSKGVFVAIFVSKILVFQFWKIEVIWLFSPFFALSNWPIYSKDHSSMYVPSTVQNKCKTYFPHSISVCLLGYLFWVHSCSICSLFKLWIPLNLCVCTMHKSECCLSKFKNKKYTDKV